MRALVMCAVVVACGKPSEPTKTTVKPEPPPVTVAAADAAKAVERRREKDNDEWCEDKAKPAAYYFGSQRDAEEAGCKLRRVHRQIEHEGKLIDDEVIVFCCPS